MQKILPIFYGSYGRYITRFRAIPYYIDCLKPVERRLLVGLYDRARTKLTKNATTVGHVMGTTHPHGDSSLAESLVNLANAGYCDSKGNFGSPGLNDARPAHMRYIECKLKKWVADLAFEYIKFVPWDRLELEPEPLYLPSPIPVGLIGSGVISGIAFHRPLIPKYSLKDLTNRLKWILENWKAYHELDKSKIDYTQDMPENIYGPKIAPATDDIWCRCDVAESAKNEYYKILFTGQGSVTYIPKGEIKGNKIHIYGRAPNSSFSSLIKDSSEANKDRPLEVRLVDISGEFINIEIIPAKRSADLNQLAKTIWSEYLIKNINFTSIVCTDDGKANDIGIDDLLINSYKFWRDAVLNSRLEVFKKANENKFEMIVVGLVRQLFEKYKSVKIDDIIDKFKQDILPQNPEVTLEDLNKDDLTYSNFKRQVNEEHIRKVCSQKSIQKLIEMNVEVASANQKIQDAKNNIATVDNDCYAFVSKLC
jgi:DNA gyrase/topoisomerase IV subunit A